MQITFNKMTALSLLRTLRANAQGCRALAIRTNIVAPDPFPRKRWSKKAFQSIKFDVPFELDSYPVDVAVPNASMRLESRSASNTTYSAALPEGAFVSLGNGLALSGPELLFAELAGSMNPVEHLMLGHELCGSFSRDAKDPYNGPITYGVKPATSTERIGAFIDQASYVHGIAHARESLRFLNDNAWSPTESLIAALLRLPIDSLGFDIGDLVLNPREHATAQLPGAKGSRVPDIVIAESAVGVNYDGFYHLNLHSVVTNAIEMGAHPEVSRAQAALNRAVRDVREKAVDDIRRNRELAAGGLFVFPVVKEDLYTPGGFDQVVEQLLNALETFSGRNVNEQRKILRKKALSRERHRAILSLLPGKSERSIQIGRFIYGNEVSTEPPRIDECWIEL